MDLAVGTYFLLIGLESKAEQGEPLFPHIVFDDKRAGVFFPYSRTVFGASPRSIDQMRYIAFHDLHTDKSKTVPCGNYKGSQGNVKVEQMLFPSILKIYDIASGELVMEKIFYPDKNCPTTLDAEVGDSYVLADSPDLEVDVIEAWLDRNARSL